MSKLTANQQETLHEVATGNPSGMLLKPVPSLIKRGLVVAVQEKRSAFPRAFGIVSTPRQETVTVYRLTEAGFAEYEALREKWYRAELARVEEKRRQDITTAAGRTVR